MSGPELIYIPIDEVVFFVVEDNLVIGKFESPDEAAKFALKRRKGILSSSTVQYIYVNTKGDDKK